MVLAPLMKKVSWYQVEFEKLLRLTASVSSEGSEEVWINATFTLYTHQRSKVGKDSSSLPTSSSLQSTNQGLPVFHLGWGIPIDVQEPPSFSFHPDKKTGPFSWNITNSSWHQRTFFFIYTGANWEATGIKKHRPYLHGSYVHIWRCRPFHLNLGWGFQWGRESHRWCHSSHTPEIPVRNYKSSLKLVCVVASPHLQAIPSVSLWLVTECKQQSKKCHHASDVNINLSR